MTGELFALLKTQSILARLMQGDAHNEAAFMLGVKRAQQNPAILALLFSVRSEGLFGAIAPQDLASYLSGLLIGAEVTQFRAPKARIATLIGATEICALYDQALEQAGVHDIDIVSGEDAAASGLWRLAQAKASA
jgi:2-dehydro-3-deoxygalactonokinase